MSESLSMAENEMCALLQSESLPPPGSAQLVDSQGNVLNVSPEQLAQAGIDINNMTEMSEEQLQILVQIATRGEIQTKSGESELTEIDKNQAGTSNSNNDLINQNQQFESSELNQSINNCNEANLDRFESNAGNHVDEVGDLTMVIGDDGSLRLVDAEQQEFLMSAQQLRENNVDVNNLTEEQVQAILNLAMAPETKVKRAEKRPASGTIPINNVSDSKKSRPNNATNSIQSPEFSQRNGAVNPNSKMIGQTVEIMKNGQVQEALIRYARKDAGFKVQFSDGHFEWIAEDQILQKGVRSQISTGTADHHSYAGDSPAKNNQLCESTDPCFTCAICSKKVRDKDPAFIVIRLPACETCAESKIMVVDNDQLTYGLKNA